MKRVLQWMEYLDTLCLRWRLTWRKHGNRNLWMHFPALLATSFWSLLLIGIFDLNDLVWYSIAMCPLLIPPLSCIVGILRSIPYLKREKSARHCLACSILGVFLYVGMIFLMALLGRY